MAYRITIVKTEPNSKFAEEIEAYNLYQNNRYRNQGEVFERPQEAIKTDALMVELSDAQYQKVKAEIIKVFE